jgi:DNA-binding PadR family transcriptional regulator
MRLARNQFQVLSLLADAEEELAGITLADAVGGIGRSSVYAALAALQRDGLVSARWDVSGSHPRRMFKITAEGLRAHAEEAERLAPMVGRVALRGA